MRHAFVVKTNVPRPVVYFAVPQSTCVPMVLLVQKKQRISVERCRMFVRNGGGIKLRLKGLCTVVLYKCDLSQLFQKIKDDEQDS